MLAESPMAQAFSIIRSICSANITAQIIDGNEPG
jgi:hypothetical protein